MHRFLRVIFALALWPWNALGQPADVRTEEAQRYGQAVSDHLSSRNKDMTVPDIPSGTYRASVIFEVKSDGRASNVVVLSKIDERLIAALRHFIERAVPFPLPPGGKPMTLILPLTYRHESSAQGLELGRIVVVGSAPPISDVATALRHQLQNCWKPVPGVERVVNVRFVLTREDRLAAPPKVLDIREGAKLDEFAKAAVNAVKTCQPFKLPADKYELWKDVEVRFDAKSFAAPASRPGIDPRPKDIMVPAR